jgi:FkbM family methyltransferase
MEWKVLADVIGGAVRRLPRGRNRVAMGLQRWFPRTVHGRDGTGLVRDFALRDLLQAQWFCGVPVGLGSDILQRLQPGDWAMDVGANTGIITGQLCRAVGPSGRVTALEPLPGNASALRQLRAANGLDQLEVLEVAAGAAATRLALRVPPAENSGWASFSATWLHGDTVEVEVASLEAIVDERPGRLSFIKIDVEGYEPEVLEGARGALAEHRPVVVMEFNDPLLKDRGSSSADLLALCVSLGYTAVDEDASSESGLAGAVRDLLLIPR